MLISLSEVVQIEEYDIEGILPISPSIRYILIDYCFFLISLENNYATLEPRRASKAQ